MKINSERLKEETSSSDEIGLHLAARKTRLNGGRVVRDADVVFVLTSLRLGQVTCGASDVRRTIAHCSVTPAPPKLKNWR